MKKHKMEIAALTLILGVLCYAFYDSNIKGSEQNIVLTNELFTMSEIKNKEDITMEMLSIPGEELKKEQEKNIVEEEIEQADQELISLENKAYSMSLAVVEESIPYNEIISNQVVNYALQFVGYPYVYGGNSLTNGTDCSGFTKLIYASYGVYLPRSAPEQAHSGVHVNLENIMPGDIFAVFSTGAYNYSMSSNYNQLPKPAVVFTYEGESRVVVRRQTFDDLVLFDEE